MVVCEDWKTRDLRTGGLGNKDLDFVGDNFPAEHNQTDICQNMNRNETIVDDGAYWPYEDNVAPPAGTADTIDFWRQKEADADRQHVTSSSWQPEKKAEKNEKDDAEGAHRSDRRGGGSSDRRVRHGQRADKFAAVWSHLQVPRTNEVTVRLIEVRKSDSPVCNEAKLLQRAGGDQLTAMQSPFLRTFKDTTFDDWPSAGFEQVVCEDWKTRPTDTGGLGNKDINFIGDNFPLPHDQFDICTNMNRSDTIFDMNEYWLYSHPDSPTVSFQRD